MLSNKKIIYLLLITYLLIPILSIDPTPSPLYIDIPFTTKNSPPLITISINDKKIHSLIDINHFDYNYITTNNINLTDIKDIFDINETIIINNKKYSAYFYIGNILLSNEILIENFESFIINETKLFSQISIYSLLDQLHTEKFINNKTFYLVKEFENVNISNQVIIGDFPFENNILPNYLIANISSNYRDNDNKKDIDSNNINLNYNNNEKIFTSEIKGIYLDYDNYIEYKNITFSTDIRYTYVSSELLNEIINYREIQQLGCKKFIYQNDTTIKCPFNSKNNLPYITFIFESFYLSFPLGHFFESLNKNEEKGEIISVIRCRNNKKNDNIDENEDEFIFGYSFISKFNVTKFDYENKIISFYGDPIYNSTIDIFSKKKIANDNAFIMLSIPLFIWSIILGIIRFNIKKFPLENED